MIQKRGRALAWGGACGVLLGTASIVAVAYFPNTFLENIGFLFVSPTMYAPVGEWQRVVLAIAYLGAFCAAFTSLLLSIKGPFKRTATGLAILATISLLHVIYARLFWSEFFEVIGSDVFADVIVKILKENAVK